MSAPRKAPATPASGGAGRKLRNPFEPKKTKMKPRKTRAITTTIFMLIASMEMSPAGVQIRQPFVLFLGNSPGLLHGPQPCSATVEANSGQGNNAHGVRAHSFQG